MEKNKPSIFTNIIKVLVSIIQGIRNSTKKLNQRMEGKYSPSRIALVVTLFATLLASTMLFIPNYLGVADDGSLASIMDAVDLEYVSDRDEVHNDFFVKTYAIVKDSTQEMSVSTSHVLLIKGAILLDDVVTKDRYFDIRFLALIYLILYIPAIYILVKQACVRVKHFSEGVVIGIVGLLIFSDVAYITYFNSFYPEAIWFISLMYCVGFALSFQEQRKGLLDLLYLALFLVAATILTTSKWQCAVIGMIIAIYCVRLIFARKNWKWVVACIFAAFYISFISIFSMVSLESDFSDTSRFHAMTRGVLFGSTDPEETLLEFGIHPSFEVLTDVSLYDSVPLVEIGNEVIQNDFLKEYSTLDIASYYARHPGKLTGMVDLTVKSSFSIRRSFCGNYEESVGLPERAKSIFWSAWSTFKDRSAPKTVGFLFVLIAAALILFGRGYSLRPVTDRRSTIFLDMMLVLMVISFSQAIVTIIYSGDVEMIRHCFLVNFGTDIVTYFVFSEVLHKLNII